MNHFFVTHRDQNAHLINQIGLDYARYSLLLVSGIMLLLIIASFAMGHRKAIKPPLNNVLFLKDSTLILKGLAIILLLLGHASQQCTVGSEALPYRITGNAAVIIFLFLSGVGLAKKYQMNVDKLYWIKRLRKLALPVWLSLVFIVPLNFLLIRHSDSATQLLLNFCGIFWTRFPNSPCWFITYILFLYVAYFTVSVISVNSRMGIRLVVLFLLPFAASWLVIATGSIDHFELWPQYSLVFPAGVLSGLYAEKIENICRELFSVSPVLFYIFLLALLWQYWTGFAVYKISHLLASELFIQIVSALVNPVSLILFLILLIWLLEMKDMRSSFLKFLGKYSFELYLLHFPFMVYYDFFLFRRPLVVFFFVYVGFMLLLSVLLQRLAVRLESFIFKKIQILTY